MHINLKTLSVVLLVVSEASAAPAPVPATTSGDTNAVNLFNYKTTWQRDVQPNSV